ncbi:transporter [Cohnella sp. CIP 111063]|jgi:cation diffusion facilitator family transporter|uniref:cation diffusion facilitator family transporter n=1 Tax=unclassified Cohnella TaxID=2636738 RepID=UPI000B8C304D|nr:MULTISPECIES: cation diffusion facilitator family transporter [unclassified Cohnella]OXS57208.1 transporter [Cohnella sp. CIP 111063]PRX70642.1 cation diffusion facilitator family transporter [Cohnella sp. SGD-V74]
MEAYQDIKQGEKGAWVSICAYIVLSALKLAVGHASGSEALLADGFNNATDIVASIAVLVGLKISRKPPDRNHRYGHFRAETVAALVASFIMMAVGVQVFVQAISKVSAPNLESPDMISGWTALLCAAAMFFVYRYNARLAKRINSQALMAAAQDNRSDALVSIGAFAGIVGSQFGIAWLDPVTALIVAAIICRTAWHIFRDATHALTDGFDETELNKLRKTIYDSPGVKGVKDIKARVHGNNVLVDVTINVNKYLNVIESHAITEKIEERMKADHNISHIHIHIEPYEAS